MPSFLTVHRHFLPGIFVTLILCGSLYLAADIIVKNMAWNDILPRYIGCEAMWQNGTSPYSDQVRADIAVLNPPGNKYQRFSYPAHICLILTPFWLAEYTLAARAWITVNFLLLGGLIFGTAEIFGNRLGPRALLVQLLVLFIGFRYSMMTLVLAQFTIFTLCCAMLAAWGLIHKRMRIVTVAFVGLTIRPDGVIVLGLLSLAALLKRQWRPVIYAGGISGLLWFITRLMAGPWVINFINDSRDYSQYNYTIIWLPDVAGWPGIIVMAAIILVFVYFLWTQRNSPPGIFYSMVAVQALALSMIVMPQTNPYVLVYIIPAGLLLLHRYWHSRAAWALWIISFGLLPWILYIAVPGIVGSEQLLYPVVLILLLYALQARHKTSEAAARTNHSYAAATD